MAKCCDKNTCKLILLVFISIIFLIALATKAAHWDLVTDKSYYRSGNGTNEVYSGLEGCIAIDAILLFFFFIAILTHFVSSLKKANIIKGLVVLLVLLFIIRIILSLLFLAGNDEAVKKYLNNCDDIGDRVCSYNSYTNTQYCVATYCGSDYTKTLRGAWGFEIVAFLLVNTLGIAAIVLLYKSHSS